MPAVPANTSRLTLVGRIHSLRLTADDVAFTLRLDRHGHRDPVEFHCVSDRPEVITAALDMQPGHLIGIIAIAPTRAMKPAALHVERLELLGRKQREEVLA